MLTYLVIGSALAFTAAIQPGPSQAYLLSRVAAVGWRRTLPGALAPLLSDGPIAILALLVLDQLTLVMQSVLRLAGGALLFYFAWRTFRQWRCQDVARLEAEGRAPRTLFEASLVQFLNPNPYLGWALILGPIVVSAWREAPSFGIAVIGAFYATMTTTLAILIYAFGSTRHFGPRFRRVLLIVSAMILAGLGVYQIVTGVRPFMGARPGAYFL